MTTIKERSRPEVVPAPFLVHPLGSHKYPITEGYIYSKAERRQHGVYFHGGIDYEAQPGTPVYAASAGYAVAFYHRFVVRNRDGTIRILDGLPIGNGFGLAVQIYHPPDISDVSGGVFTQYGHLSGFAESITPKMTAPIEMDIIGSLRRRNQKRRSGKLTETQLASLIKEQKQLIDDFPWLKFIYGYHTGQTVEEQESYLWTPNDLFTFHQAGSPYVTHVNQGDLIGYTGESPLFWGNTDYDEDNIPFRIPPKDQEKRWDEPHLHFELAYRNDGPFRPKQQIDPYDLYLSWVHYNGKLDTLFVDS
ncbi:M23 family metallopeptidase [Candidatus Nomurabacteria bacterium]|nr:M23 family metallopeptidase [Candidatus Nomurabacteria bacterium]